MIRDEETFAQLLDTVTRYVRESLMPQEAWVEEHDDIPDATLNEMKELGLFGLTIPEAYGGLGLTTEEEVRVALALGYVSPAFRSAIATNNGIGSKGIVLEGTEEQKARYLPAMAAGEIIGSFALTEPDVGSDAASVRATGVRDGDHFVLNGTKRYITNAPRAHVFTTMVRTRPDVPGANGVTAFLVDADLPGLSLGKRDRKMGQAGSWTCDVVFDDVRVPASAIIGGIEQEGRGFRTAMRVLDPARLHIAAICVGAAERLIDESLRFAMERRQFGKPIAEHQLIQAMLADSRAEAYAGRSMVIEAARAQDAGRQVSTEAACAKLFCSEMVGRVADRAVQIHGGAGYMREYPVERFFRDVRLFRIFEGTSQIQQIVIARNMVREAG